MLYITRKFHFSASHRVYNPALSDDENFKLYGKCSNPNGHGHNYEMEITVAGKINNETGYVMDLSELKNIVESSVISKVDHKNLNLDVDFMSGILPSTENIAKAIWDELESLINNKNRKLHSIKIRETINNSVEYTGED